MTFPKRAMLLLPAMLFALASFTPLGAAEPPPPAALAFTPSIAGYPPSSGLYNFGTLDVGTTASQIFTLTNIGGTASGALTISLGAEAGVFTKTADTCTGISLGPGKSCSVTVQYSPSGVRIIDGAVMDATNSNKKKPTSATIFIEGNGPSE